MRKTQMRKPLFKDHGWNDVKVYKISAEWIMSQVNKPRILNRIRII